MSSRLLHITNGRAIIPMMQAAAVPGRIVPWDDVLHEGPVPAGLNVAALRHVRAEFIAMGDGSYDEVARGFAERDRALDELGGVDELVLWFEHDLYDQLQLIQVLDRLPAAPPPVVTAVPGDDYLGTQPASAFATLFPARRPISSSQRLAAHDAWDAFRASDPRAVVDALPRVTELPHLAPALRRHLQQFPSIHNGLSRTEQQALEAMAGGMRRVKDIYVGANHQREDALFMADLPFLFHLGGLVRPPRPLILAPRARLSLDDEVELTDDGRQVLAGEADRVHLCGIDRWLGGVHLQGTGPVWRWDARAQELRFA